MSQRHTVLVGLLLLILFSVQWNWNTSKQHGLSPATDDIFLALRTRKQGMPGAGAPFRGDREAALGEQGVCPMLDAWYGGADGQSDILVVVTNLGSALLTQNMLCSARRQGITRWIVMSMDPSTCDYLHDSGYVFRPGDGPESQAKPGMLCIDYYKYRPMEPEFQDPLLNNGKVLELSDEFFSKAHGWEDGSAAFTFLLSTKLYAVRDTLQCGFNVFLLDADTILFRNAYEYFHATQDAHPTVFATFQLAKRDTANSGMFYMVTSPRSIKFMNDTINMTWWFIDQSRVNMRLKELPPGSFQYAENKLFPSGSDMHQWIHSTDDLVFAAGLKKLLEPKPVAAHVNWSSGVWQKMEMLRKIGYWFVNLDPGHGAMGMCLKTEGKLSDPVPNSQPPGWPKCSNDAWVVKPSHPIFTGRFSSVFDGFCRGKKRDKSK